MFLEYNKKDCFSREDILHMSELFPRIKFLGYVYLNFIAIKSSKSRVHIIDRVSTEILSKFEIICVSRTDDLYNRFYVNEDIDIDKCAIISTVYAFFKNQKEFSKYKLMS